MQVAFFFLSFWKELQEICNSDSLWRQGLRMREGCAEGDFDLLSNVSVQLRFSHIRVFHLFMYLFIHVNASFDALPYLSHLSPCWYLDLG